jgi:hypothetical protein
VTFYNKDKIYVHVLDWGDKRGLAFPPVTDRLVLKSNVLNGKPVKVQQAPWGLNASVPVPDRPNDIDTIVVLQVEGDAAELVAPRTVAAGPLETILLQADTARRPGRSGC